MRHRSHAFPTLLREEAPCPSSPEKGELRAAAEAARLDDFIVDGNRMAGFKPSDQKTQAPSSRPHPVRKSHGATTVNESPNKNVKDGQEWQIRSNRQTGAK